MGLRAILFDRMSGFAGITALVGTRLYPLRLKEDTTYPALVYRVITDPSVARSHHGKPDRKEGRAQIDCYAETGDAAATLGDQVEAAWDGYSSPGNDCTVGYAFVANRSDRYDTSLRVFRDVIDITVEHEA